jgi:hypothetical protein
MRWRAEKLQTPTAKLREVPISEKFKEMAGWFNRIIASKPMAIME